MSVIDADDRDAWTFETQDTHVFALNEGDVVLYARDQDTAWLACQDAPYLHEWR